MSYIGIAPKVVALFRDPRGILSSRERLEWCGEENCNNYTRFCADYRGDLEEARLMKKDNPDSIFIVR